MQQRSDCLNYQKYVTAMLYATEVPLGVWAGFSFGAGQYTYGLILTAVMMCIEILAVVTWMNAQTIEIETGQYVKKRHYHYVRKKKR